MAPEATSKALSSLTAPIYTSSFEGVIAEVEAGSGSEAQQSGTLALRMQDLLLDPSEAHAIEAAANKQQNLGPEHTLRGREQPTRPREEERDAREM